jgi:hypothetical protein
MQKKIEKREKNQGNSKKKEIDTKQIKKEITNGRRPMTVLV